MLSAARILLAAVLAGALATPAAAAPKKNPKSPQETSAYWTAERMKNAKPRERAKPGGGGGGGRETSDWSRFTVPLDTSGRYGIADRTNGKVFFTLGGSNYVCSGTAVAASADVNLVWTAGHCVTDGPDEFATNFMFVPGYYKGQEPFGRWAFNELDSTPGWEAQGSDRFRYDVGAARVVHTTDSTLRFAGVIGTRPITFGLDPTSQRIVSYGYPAAGKFNGSQQYACASPFRRWDTAPGDPMQISCDMTGGSSGGGWFHDANGNWLADSGEPLISVNSYGYYFEKTTMYGPYMGDRGQAKDLYDLLD